MDDSLILPRHFGLCDIHVWDKHLCDLRKHFCKAQKWKLLTGLTSALKENYKFAQKEDENVKKICLFKHYFNVMDILFKMQLFRSQHAIILIIYREIKDIKQNKKIFMYTFCPYKFPGDKCTFCPEA
jgi:hypothetical protein